MRLKIITVLFALAAAFTSAAGEVAFNSDIRPLLAERCFECHGPAKTKAGLRLDKESSATKTLKSGRIAINRHATGESELLRRIRPEAAEDRMPPTDSGKTPLSEKQIALLERWISEGARWDQHWAFKPIKRPALPKATFPELANNAIDAFIQRDLAAHNLSPSEKASARILDRRLAFDLAGLPPFINVDSWEEKIDAYLAAPSFGERMALWWLDLVRYADTEGYFYDSDRNIYPYRDYVIHSFNANKPFDQFTAEQLAGDLLSNSGPDQKIASGYNRLILTTHETGANAAEYRARYAADRVRNLGSVWLGLTFGCAQCHDHKFDPISTGDFYRMSAFFADVDEEAVQPQREVFPTITSAEYRALVERSEALRAELGDYAEIQCAQVLVEDEFAQTGCAPTYWPKSKRTDEVAGLLRAKIDGRASAAEERDLAGYFARHYRVKVQREFNEVMKARETFERNAQPTLITQQAAPQTIRILPRGNWMDQSGPQVHAAFPEFLGAANCNDTPNRAELAKWLTSAQNPLTARVIVNRLWQLFFGEGLVRSVDDFGAQGEAPSHPELLDYLASELIDSSWDIKHTVRLILTSHTYQQMSSAGSELLEKDPENRLFARQNRFGLPAEFVRDNARAISGLLSFRADGPPVVPAGSVQTDMYGKPPFADSGQRLYRRAIYLYRKRTFLHPSLAAFNASMREECVSERTQARAPQQALALLNSPDFVECARAFAELMYDSSSNNREKIKFGFNIAINRDPSEQEQSVLLALFEQQHKSFAADPISAAKFIRTSALPWPTHVAAADLAAWTDVGRAILNLDETNMRY